MFFRELKGFRVKGRGFLRGYKWGFLVIGGKFGVFRSFLRLRIIKEGGRGE